MDAVLPRSAQDVFTDRHLPLVAGVARLGIAGQRRAARFTWDATAEATWAVYRRALR